MRDLVVFLNGQPTSATFGSAESLIFHSEGSITLPIYFSKPVTGTLKFDLGGNAAFGVAQDYTITPSQRTLTNAVQTQITVHFQPWRGFGGEKSIRLTLNRDPVAVPLNGRFSSHLVRVRQFQQGEFVGMLNFPAGAGLPSLSIRIGLNNSGSAICSFQDANTILGSQIPLSWSGVSGCFPTFNGLETLSLTGNTCGRSNEV